MARAVSIQLLGIDPEICNIDSRCTFLVCGSKLGYCAFRCLVKRKAPSFFWCVKNKLGCRTFRFVMLGEMESTIIELSSTLVTNLLLSFADVTPNQTH